MKKVTAPNPSPELTLGTILFVRQDVEQLHSLINSISTRLIQGEPLKGQDVKDEFSKAVQLLETINGRFDTLL